MSRNPQGEPRTEAGQALLDTIRRGRAPFQGDWAAAIGQVEAEAAAPVEGLREALTELRAEIADITEYPSHGPDEDFRDGWNVVKDRALSLVDDRLAALRAVESPAHPETGLDRERLARAIEKVTLTPVTLGPDLDESLTEYEWQAEAIAREYAAEYADAP